VIQWAALIKLDSESTIGDHLLAIPNAGKRSAKAGNREKRMGLKSGASDLFLAIPMGYQHGLWIEMKKQRQHFKSLSEQIRAVQPSQSEWIERMKRRSYAAVVAYGANEAIQIIEHYLHGWENETGNA